MNSENSNLVVRLDSFSKQIYIIWVFLDLYQSLRRLAELQHFPLASFAISYWVTDEALISEN